MLYTTKKLFNNMDRPDFSLSTQEIKIVLTVILGSTMGLSLSHIADNPAIGETYEDYKNPEFEKWVSPDPQLKTPEGTGWFHKRNSIPPNFQTVSDRGEVWKTNGWYYEEMYDGTEGAFTLSYTRVIERNLSTKVSLPKTGERERLIAHVNATNVINTPQTTFNLTCASARIQAEVIADDNKVSKIKEISSTENNTIKWEKMKMDVTKLSGKDALLKLSIDEGIKCSSSDFTTVSEFGVAQHKQGLLASLLP